jgi:ribose 1,5-bisphosphokinase
VSAAEFDTLSEAGAFALQWPAHGLRYGIRATEFEALDQGRDVLFNGSRTALPQSLHRFPGLIILRITAPSRVLAERLAQRGRETATEIEARLARASYDVPEGIPVIDVANDATPEIGVARLVVALQAAKG